VFIPRQARPRLLAEKRMQPLSKYEVARLQRIAENKKTLAALGVSSAKDAIREAAENNKLKRKRKRQNKKPLFKTRFSARTENSKKISYNSHATNFDFFHGNKDEVVLAESMYESGSGLERPGGRYSRKNKLQKCPKEFQLPESWTIVRTIRKGGATKGRQDKYFKPPGTEIYLRSMSEVFDFIQNGNKKQSSTSSSSSSSPVTSSKKIKKKKT
jgi:hypothetical protein